MSDPLVQDFSIYVYFKLCFFKRKKFRFYIDSVGFMSWGYVKFHNNYHNDKYTRCYKYLKNCLPVPHFEHRSLPAISSPLISHASGLAASRRNQGVLYTQNDRSSPHPHVFALNASTSGLTKFLQMPLNWVSGWYFWPFKVHKINSIMIR